MAVNPGTGNRSGSSAMRSSLRGSLETLKATILLAMTDYRDVLIGEQIDPWVAGELRLLKIL